MANLLTILPPPEQVLILSVDEKRYLIRQSKMLRRATPQTPKHPALKFRKWRKSRGVKRCRECGRRLTNEAHHTLCNGCWEKKQKGRS